jgi:hypothetical protein
MSPRRLATALALAALVPGLSACGNKEERLHHGETEGVYVDVDQMKYQVQISRELNPGAISEDRTFVSGVAAADLQVAADETWFAVFVRIENETEQPQKPAIEYVIEDTEGNEYTPVPLARDNPFHYVLDAVPGKSRAPDPDSVAAQTSIGGMELLFKLKRTSLDDRPLILKIHSPTNADDVSEVDLDV